MILKRRDKELISQMLKEREETIDMLTQIVKAIINKFETKEIIVYREELEKAKEYELYKTNEILKRATKYQLINPKQLLKNYKEE